MSEEDRNRFLAGRLDTLAVCYHMNGQRALAIKTIKRCIELDPGEQTYQDRLAYFEKNKK